MAGNIQPVVGLDEKKWHFVWGIPGTHYLIPLYPNSNELSNVSPELG